MAAFARHALCVVWGFGLGVLFASRAAVPLLLLLLLHEVEDLDGGARSGLRKAVLDRETALFRAASYWSAALASFCHLQSSHWPQLSGQSQLTRIVSSMEFLSRA